MTARRLTMAEGEELLATAFDLAAEPVATDADGILDEVVAGISAADAFRVIEDYLSIMPGNIDPDSIQITPDTLDDAPAMDACRIIIKTREWQ